MCIRDSHKGRSAVGQRHDTHTLHTGIDDGALGGEKGGDEVWIAEKFQSNPEIADSPRNSFRASLETV